MAVAPFPAPPRSMTSRNPGCSASASAKLMPARTSVTPDPVSGAWRREALEHDELGGVVACISQPSRPSLAAAEQAAHHGARAGSAGHVGGGGVVWNWLAAGRHNGLRAVTVRDHVTIRPSQG
jgi:hypothetical protein